MGLTTCQPGAACPPRPPWRASEIRPGAWPALRASQQVTFPCLSPACGSKGNIVVRSTEGSRISQMRFTPVGAQTRVLGGVSSQNGSCCGCLELILNFSLLCSNPGFQSEEYKPASRVLKGSPFKKIANLAAPSLLAREVRMSPLQKLSPAQGLALASGLSKQGPPFPGGTSEEPTCQCRRLKRRWIDSWVGKIRWRRAWQPTPVFLPGESLGQRSLA